MEQNPGQSSSSSSGSQAPEAAEYSGGGKGDDAADSQVAVTTIRRNALTPEAHNVDPIRQTELQEKMCNLDLAATVTGGGGGGNSDDGSGCSSGSSGQGASGSR